MTHHDQNLNDLQMTASLIEDDIKAASFDARLSMKPKLEELIQKFDERGMSVPPRLRQLDAQIGDDLVEAYFDNMPV